MIALIARADDSGVGVQTWELARHIPFARILVVRVNDGPGNYRAERYDGLAPEVRYCNDPLGRSDIAWLLECSDVVTVENFYARSFVEQAPQAGVALWVHANPELYPPGWVALADAGIVNVLAPTEWERDRYGKHRLLPMPVDRERCKFVRREGPARRLLHVSARAMLDRNGTAMVREAVKHYTGPAIKLFISGPAAPDQPVMVGRVRVVPAPHVDDYWNRYDGIDALVQPRRYGGLSLVVQEALSCGVPVLALDRVPEREWCGVVTVPVTGSDMRPMKGGQFSVDYTDPETLARGIEALATCDLGVLSDRADEWGQYLDWREWDVTWRRVLE